jgi:hypothetical protein
MAARPHTNTTDSTRTHDPQRKVSKKLTRPTDSTPPIRIHTRRSEMSLSPNDEHECRQIYEKLQRLQPNGVCVDLNTLRRALYPPTSISKNINDQILAFKKYRQR